MTVVDMSLGAVYARHALALTRFASGLVGPSDAPDVVSEAMASLMVSHAWSKAVNHRALMYQAVLYQAKTFRRARYRRLRREHRAALWDVGGPADVDPDLASTVMAALSPQQRAVVFLTYWEDLEARSVADLLGVSEGTVRKQLGRARIRLREVLQ